MPMTEPVVDKGNVLDCFVCGKLVEAGNRVALTGQNLDRRTIRLHEQCATKLAAEVLEAVHCKDENQAQLQAKPGDAAGLTALEQRIVEGIVAGETNRQIARRTGKAESTIRNVVSVVLSKLEASSRTQAAVQAIRFRLVE